MRRLCGGRNMARRPRRHPNRLRTMDGQAKWPPFPPRGGGESASREGLVTIHAPGICAAQAAGGCLASTAHPRSRSRERLWPTAACEWARSSMSARRWKPTSSAAIRCAPPCRRRDVCWKSYSRASRELQTGPQATADSKKSVVADTIERLTELGLIDDTQVAAQFIESRSRSHPQALRLSRSELAARGVGRDRVDAAVEAMGERDELPLARAALAKRVRALPDDKDARREAYQRHAAFLARRGFGWDIVRKALAEVFDPAETDDIPPE